MRTFPASGIKKTINGVFLLTVTEKIWRIRQPEIILSGIHGIGSEAIALCTVRKLRQMAHSSAISRNVPTDCN